MGCCHFLYADDYFPVDALALLDEMGGFLSKPAAQQCAVDKGN
jgi:hypothetical protein